MFFVISQIQAVIIALGDLFFLKIQCDNPLLFIITCMISATVYSLIIYSLTITFSVVGKALAVIILIMQVAGSGDIGTQGKASAIADVVKCRETTNQKLISLYEKMYDKIVGTPSIDIDKIDAATKILESINTYSMDANTINSIISNIIG